MIFNTNKLIGLLVIATALTACSSDDETGVQQSANNANANDVSVKTEYGRMEFPRLKGNGNRVLIHYSDDGQLNYAVEWNEAKKSQRWSCYQLYKKNMEENTIRYTSKTNQYPRDPLLPTSLWFASDPFWGSGYDHGHICPSADRLYSANANYQTFFVTNMQPQLNDFNAGVWANMEKAVRNIAGRNNYKFCDTLYICKGGTIDRPTDYTTIRQNLLVPKYFFMAIMRVKDGQYNAMGFWISHEKNKDTKLAKYAVTIKELEEKTGIDFFCNLPDNREQIIESAAVNANFWGLK